MPDQAQPQVSNDTNTAVAQPAQAPAVAPAMTTPMTGQTPAPAAAGTGRYKVEVIREKCISAASCTHIAGKTFKLDEENIAVVIGQNLEADETILLGAQSCPTGAIIVTDTQTGEQVWPKE